MLGGQLDKRKFALRRFCPAHPVKALASAEVLTEDVVVHQFFFTGEKGTVQQDPLALEVGVFVMDCADELGNLLGILKVRSTGSPAVKV